MTSTSVTQHVKAPRERVYRALTDVNAIAKWKVPDGMSCTVHSYELREGGSFRISLTYQATQGVGKTSPHTDTYNGYFVELVPNERIVEMDEFKSSDSALQGKMKITIILT